MEKYFDLSYLWGAIPALLPFLKVTFTFVFWSVLFGTLLGLLLTWMKIQPKNWIKKIAEGYTTVLRCTPSIVLLFLVYYGIPYIFMTFGVNIHHIEKIIFVIIAFTLQFAAIISEVFRSSYDALDKGQIEAGLSVGMTPFQMFRRIIFPQAFLIALPNFGNSFVLLLHEGAIAYTIGLIDVVGKAELIIADNFNTHALEIFLALAFIYWILSLCIEKVFQWLEKIFRKGHIA